ncbi:hypothetical protein PMAYCL1PPCAC_19194, partial [Pristionchus mayeri]
LLPLLVLSRANPPHQKHAELPNESDDFHLVHHLEVEASQSRYSYAAKMDNVTVEFQLQKIKAEDKNMPLATYKVNITNNSDKKLCGVVFKPDQEFFDETLENLVETNGNLITKELGLISGSSTSQYSFVTKDL